VSNQGECANCGKRDGSDGGWVTGWYLVAGSLLACSEGCARAVLRDYVRPDYDPAGAVEKCVEKVPHPEGGFWQTFEDVPL
jgi:hypothetical protein